MNVSEYATATGVSPRRIRARIHDGSLQAEKVGRVWILANPQSARGRRPLSQSSQKSLAMALHHRSLAGLTGQTRLRTAARIRALRESDDPSTLLSDWWGGKMPPVTDSGTALAAHGVMHHDDYVLRAVRSRQPEYLRDPAELADLVSSERAIRGLSRSALAQLAGVEPMVVSAIERGRPGYSLRALRDVLRALAIEASALPSMSLS